jgi:hypothetical protein
VAVVVIIVRRRMLRLFARRVGYASLFFDFRFRGGRGSAMFNVCVHIDHPGFSEVSRLLVGFDASVAGEPRLGALDGA